MGKVIHKDVSQWRDKELSNLVEDAEHLTSKTNDRRKSGRKRTLYNKLLVIESFAWELKDFDRGSMKLAVYLLQRKDPDPQQMLDAIRALTSIIKDYS